MHRAGAVKGLPFTIGGLNMYVYIYTSVCAGTEICKCDIVAGRHLQQLQ